MEHKNNTKEQIMVASEKDPLLLLPVDNNKKSDNNHDDRNNKPSLPWTNNNSTNTIHHLPNNNATTTQLKSALKTYSHPNEYNINNNNNHRRRLSDLFVTTNDGIRHIVDDVKVTARDVRNVFHENINQTRTGQRGYFLDMNITRNLSVLPENLNEFLQEAFDDFNFTSLSERSSTHEHHPLLDDGRKRISGSTDEENKDQEQQEEVIDSSTSSGNMITAFIGLFVAVIAVSSNGTALSLLHDVSPCLKLYWRMTATSLLLSFFAIRTIIREMNNSNNNDVNDDNDDNDNDNVVLNSSTSSHFMKVLMSKYKKMNIRLILEFTCAVVCFTIHTILFFYAFEYTTIGNAVIFANSQALLLIIGKVFIGESVLFIEVLGVMIAFTGAILCSADSEADETIIQESITLTNTTNVTTPSVLIDNMTNYSILDNNNITNITTMMMMTTSTTTTITTIIDTNDNEFFENLFGDALALGAAIFGVIYLTFAKAVRTQMNVTVFMFLVMFFGSFLVLLFMILFNIEFQFNDHPIYGLFGWITLHNNHIYILIYIAIICNVCGTMGFVRAMQYFDNLIIAVATLLEPMIASFIAYIFHVGQLPGLYGCIGNIMVAIGTFGVVYPSIHNNNNSSSKDGNSSNGH